MSKTIIAEGKTTNEAIEKGLKELNVSKNKVDIKVLENDDKRSFFSILAPRIVKVELTVKDDVVLEEIKKIEKKENKNSNISAEDLENASKNIKDFFKQLDLFEEDACIIEIKDNVINISITSEKSAFLIGYRGETLYALQNILTTIAGKNSENRIKIILDIEGYKAKREKTLEELAEKVAKTVIRNKKSIKLEPMQAYERKIIHSKLQNNKNIETVSVGEEPNRRLIISYKA